MSYEVFLEKNFPKLESLLGSKSKICAVFTGTQLFHATQLSSLGFQSELFPREICFPLNTSVCAWKDIDVQVSERMMAVLNSSGEAAEAEFLEVFKETSEATHQTGACSRYNSYGRCK